MKTPQVQFNPDQYANRSLFAFSCNPVALSARPALYDLVSQLDDAILPDSLQTIFKSQDVVQVNLAAESGDMGILANHVPSIEALKPGVLEVIDGSDNKKWFGAHPWRFVRAIQC